MASTTEGVHQLNMLLRNYSSKSHFYLLIWHNLDNDLMGLAGSDVKIIVLSKLEGAVCCSQPNLRSVDVCKAM